MSVYTLTIASRTSSTVTIDISWTPDSSFYYDAYVYCRIAGSNVGGFMRDFGGGVLSGGTTYYASGNITGLTSNTQCQFYGEMRYRSSSSDLWTIGGATASTSVLTYPAAPSGVSAVLTNNNTSLQVSWTQNLGGGDADVINYVEICPSSGGSRLLYKENITSASSSRNCLFNDITSLSAGTYQVKVYANNSATVYDGDTTSLIATTMFTISGGSGPSGYFRTGPTVTVENGVASYSGTWYQTSQGSVAWQFQVSINSQYNNIIYNQTQTLNQYRIRNVEGTTNASVGDVFWFHVETNGFDEYFSVTATGDGGGGGGQQLPTQATISNVTVEAYKASVIVQWDLVLPEASLRGYTGEVTIGPSRNTPQGIAANDDGSYQAASGRVHFSVPFSGLSLRTKVHYGFKIIMWSGVYGGSQSTWGEMGLEYVGDFVITPLLLEWSWETASGSWNAENQSGHSSLAIAARNALQNKTETTNFSHLIWNDIIDWLTDNLDLLDTSYSSSTASSAKMTTTPYNLTAVKWNYMISLWNTLKNAIESNNNYTMQNQSAGNPVNAALFIGANGFINIMNDSINNYNT